MGGIVLTGGGAQLLHFRNLSELKTGFDTRLGHATEYLAKGMIEEVNGPIFATGTGLVIYGLKNGVISGPNYQMATSTDAIKKSPGSNFLSKIKSWFLDSNNLEHIQGFVLCATPE